MTNNLLEIDRNEQIKEDQEPPHQTITISSKRQNINETRNFSTSQTHQQFNKTHHQFTQTQQTQTRKTNQKNIIVGTYSS
jgi:hypothetical protein